MAEYIDTKTIGGSDVGALLGLNTYSTPQDVYNRLVDPKPHHGSSDDDNGAKRRGKAMEPIIADEYTLTTGRMLQCVERVFHPVYEYCHASPDYAIVSGDRFDSDGVGALEIKCHNAYVFKQAVEEGVNKSYYAQLQHYLWVTGWQWGSFGLFWADGWELHWFDVERDESMIARIEETVSTFWNTNVLNRVPPSGEIAPVEIPAKHRGQNTQIVKRDDPEWRTIVDRYKIACETFDLAKHNKELTEARLKDLMGDAKTVIGGGGKFTLSEGTNSSIDREKLTSAYPAIDLAQFVKRTSFEKFTKTWEKPR